MSSKKKVTPPEPVFSSERPVPKKWYMLFARDVGTSPATYHAGRITIVHSDEAYFQILDHGSGYEITDVSPSGTKKISMDYSLAADLFASLKIFYHNADKINGEYWTIFQGEKI